MLFVCKAIYNVLCKRFSGSVESGRELNLDYVLKDR